MSKVHLAALVGRLKNLRKNCRTADDFMILGIFANFFNEQNQVNASKSVKLKHSCQVFANLLKKNSCEPLLDLLSILTFFQCFLPIEN